MNLLGDKTESKFCATETGSPPSMARTRTPVSVVFHLTIDTATGVVWAGVFTSSREGESPIPPYLLGLVTSAEPIAIAISGRAFDTWRCHMAILDRNGTAIIPTRKNGRPRK